MAAAAGHHGSGGTSVPWLPESVGAMLDGAGTRSQPLGSRGEPPSGRISGVFPLHPRARPEGGRSAAGRGKKWR